MSVVKDTFRETGSSLGTVFRNPGLRRINLAFAGSAIGDWAYATAILVWAYDFGGVAAVGIWGTTRLILMALVTPFASTLVDKFSRKAIMVTTDLIRAGIILVAAVLIETDTAPAAVFVLATLTGLVAAPFRPAVAALVPHLVNKPEELTASNGASSTVESLAFFVGPALGGLMLTWFDIPAVLIFNVLTFLWSAALVYRIKVPAKETPSKTNASTPASVTTSEDGPASVSASKNGQEASESFWTESMAGFKTIWAHPDLRLITLVYCAQTIVAGASIVFVVAMAVDMTNFGARGVGYLDSMLGVGAILGGLFAIGRATARKLATDFGVGVIFWALPLLLAAIWPSQWAAFVAMFIIGFANPVVDVNASTILQRLAGDEVMGRVFGALETGLIAAMALGSMLMPLLVSLFGLQWALAVLALLITVIVLPAMGRLRSLDRELGAPEGLPLLRGLPLFAPLEPKSLELVAQRLIRVEVAAGDAVITEGETGDRFYVIETGRATATYRGDLLSHMGPGDPFGEIALLRDVPRTATVIADEPTVLMALERADFMDAVTGDSEVNNRADDLVARRIPTY